MFKLVVLSALLAVAVAKPSDIQFASAQLAYAASAPIISKTVTYEAAPVVKTTVISEPAHIEVREPVVAKVGNVVHNVSTTTSHKTSTVVTSKSSFASPIVAPAVKTYTAPVVKTTYTAPIITSQQYAPAPIATAHVTAPVLKTYATEQVVHSYAAPLTYTTAPVVKTIQAPLTYTAPIAHGW